MATVSFYRGYSSNAKSSDGIYFTKASASASSLDRIYIGDNMVGCAHVFNGFANGAGLVPTQSLPDGANPGEYFLNASGSWSPISSSGAIGNGELTLNVGSSSITSDVLSGFTANSSTNTSYTIPIMESAVYGVAKLGYTTNTGTGVMNIAVSISDGNLYVGVPTGTTSSSLALGNHTHTNMVTGSSLTADKIILGNGSSKIKASTYGISTSFSATPSSSSVPTESAIANYFSGLAGAMRYMGSLSGSSLPAGVSGNKGDVYIASAAISALSAEQGDMIILKDTVSTAGSLVGKVDVFERDLTGAITSSATGGGTTNALAKFTGAFTIGNAGTAGTATKGIYLSNGVPTAMTHTLGASIPSATTSDNGKILTISSGTPSWATPPSVQITWNETW